MSRPERLRLPDILDAMDRIASYVEDIPWSEIIGLRNVIIHQYFGILAKIVWDVIKSELPPLRSQIAEL